MMTNDEKIRLIEVLSNGYAKPDLSDTCCSGERTVRETKKFMPVIENLINSLVKNI